MLSKKNIEKIRNEFPILKEKIYNKSLIYFDNAATTQKPKKVIESSKFFYSKINSNVHRSMHFLSRKSTLSIENVRKNIQKFICAKYDSEIIFTKGTTESINLVASSISNFINKGDEILISHIEHHSNIVPWQNICNIQKSILKIIPINKNGVIDLNKFESLISKKTKIVSICHISNVLGIINPIKYIIDKSHKFGAWVLIDGAQAVSHLCLNMQELDVDFYVFSGHKMYGPTGVGILYGKKDILKCINPYQFGGEMIKNVSLEKTTFSCVPFKFEAGTPNIEGIFVLGESINFIRKIGLKNIQNYEKKLVKYAINKLEKINDIYIYGKINKIDKKSSIISFNLNKLHCFDVGSILDRLGIAVRTGYLCAQPLMNFFKINGMIRISFSIYNTFEEIDYLFDSLIKAKKMLKRL
ncbi:aminotransferase class V-fold PLP-dependent enzyme [Blattabacterium cuenoti]|uniref:aminotransferase class V-fold PLP-dependent enzyme n=1 Tax=Blattabacterium cuenoti TaxID=1653831 RepID=UPI00163D1AFA|nr:SufS family cysteine desulfurase [Blattabacterium cuenoti]